MKLRINIKIIAMRLSLLYNAERLGYKFLKAKLMTRVNSLIY